MHILCYTYEGVDRIARSLLREVKTVRYLDIGANHPIRNSCTYLFYTEGGSGVAIDANLSFVNMWEAERPRDIFVCGLVSDKSANVDFLVFADDTMSSADPETSKRYKDRGIPCHSKAMRSQPLEEFDFFAELTTSELHLMCVDVEGMDEKVLLGSSIEKIAPGVIVVETKNANLHRVLEHPTVNLLKSMGYALISKTPLDAVFIDPRKPYLQWVPSSLYD